MNFYISWKHVNSGFFEADNLYELSELTDSLLPKESILQNTC